MKTLIENIKWIGSFALIVIAIGFLQYLNEEPAHMVNINGKQYIRSKEYAGNNTYQIILIPADTIK
jgi:hypothetical protein